MDINNFDLGPVILPYLTLGVRADIAKFDPAGPIWCAHCGIQKESDERWAIVGGFDAARELVIAYAHLACRDQKGEWLDAAQLPLSLVSKAWLFGDRPIAPQAILIVQPNRPVRPTDSFSDANLHGEYVPLLVSLGFQIMKTGDPAEMSPVIARRWNLYISPDALHIGHPELGLLSKIPFDTEGHPYSSEWASKATADGYVLVITGTELIFDADESSLRDVDLDTAGLAGRLAAALVAVRVVTDNDL